MNETRLTGSQWAIVFTASRHSERVLGSLLGGADDTAVTHCGTDSNVGAATQRSRCLGPEVGTELASRQWSERRQSSRL